jgi:hypothetical protein
MRERDHGRDFNTIDTIDQVGLSLSDQIILSKDLFRVHVLILRIFLQHEKRDQEKGKNVSKSYISSSEV